MEPTQAMFNYAEDSDSETSGTRDEGENEETFVAALTVWVPVSSASSTTAKTPATALNNLEETKASTMLKFKLTGNDTIGRDPSKNSIVVDTESISSEHATIVAFEKTILLTPCKSTNGTWRLNERTMKKERLKPSLPVSLSKEEVFYCADVKCKLETKEAYLRWKRGELEPASAIKTVEDKGVSRDSDCESMTQAYPNVLGTPEKSFKTPVTPETVSTRKTGVTTAKTANYMTNTEEPTQRMCGMISNETQTAEKLEDSSSRSSDMMFGAYDEEVDKEPVRRIDFEIEAKTKPEDAPVPEEDDRSTVVEDPVELANEQATQMAELETVEEEPHHADTTKAQSTSNDNGSESAAKNPTTEDVAGDTVQTTEAKSATSADLSDGSTVTAQHEATAESVQQTSAEIVAPEKPCVESTEKDETKVSKVQPDTSPHDSNIEQDEDEKAEVALAEPIVQSNLKDAPVEGEVGATPSGVVEGETKKLPTSDGSSENPAETVGDTKDTEMIAEDIEADESHVEPAESCEETDTEPPKAVTEQKHKVEETAAEVEEERNGAQKRLTRLTVRQLKSRLKRAGQDTNGTKPILIQRMIDAGLHVTRSKQSSQTSPGQKAVPKVTTRRSTRKRQRPASKGEEFVTSTKKKRVSAVQSGVSARKARRKVSNEEVRIVLTSHRLSSSQEKKLSVFNAKLIEDVENCTHLVVKKGSITRTLKLLYAMSKPNGPYIVHDGWINESAKLHHKAEEHKFVPYDNRYVGENQKKIKFNLEKGLERRKKGRPLLADKKVIVTRNVNPDKDKLLPILENMGAKVVDKPHRHLPSAESTVVITCEKDLNCGTVKEYRKYGIGVFNVTWLTHGLMEYALDQSPSCTHRL